MSEAIVMFFVCAMGEMALFAALKWVVIQFGLRIPIVGANIAVHMVTIVFLILLYEFALKKSILRSTSLDTSALLGLIAGALTMEFVLKPWL
jgi:hypothetical protein